MFGARYHASINKRIMVLNLHNILITNDFCEVSAAFLNMVFEVRTTKPMLTDTKLRNLKPQGKFSGE